MLHIITYKRGTEFSENSLIVTKIILKFKREMKHITSKTTLLLTEFSLSHRGIVFEEQHTEVTYQQEGEWTTTGKEAVGWATYLIFFILRKARFDFMHSNRTPACQKLGAASAAAAAARHLRAPRGDYSGAPHRGRSERREAAAARADRPGGKAPSGAR